MSLINRMRDLVRHTGFDLRRYDRRELGLSLPEDSIRILSAIATSRTPMIFDVGANVGQSIQFFKRALPNANVHAFEPSPTTFRLLREACSFPDVVLVNQGVGSTSGVLKLIENEHSDVSSFLKPTGKMWGRVVGEVEVEVTTIDSYAERNGVDRIDFLKIDTQGFDLEVLKGATRMASLGQIKLVQLEITLADLYEGLPRVDVVLKFLLDQGFRVVGLYGFHHNHMTASWTDALLVHESITPANTPLE